MMSDPLSMLAAQEEVKQAAAFKAKQEQEERDKQRNHVEEEEKRLESITKIHLRHPSLVGLNSNINNIEIKDRSMITKKKWMNSFCIVNFDLEIGQSMSLTSLSLSLSINRNLIITNLALDYSYPKTSLRSEEITNLCFLSFPDSNSHLQGDIIYCIKLKHLLNGGGKDGNHESDDNAHEYGYQYGYVFFRQEKDETIPRGYLQKSVVLLSDEPFVGLYKKVMEVVGPLYFQYGNTLLEVAYQNMANWPELKLGQTYELPILGSIFTFHVPYTVGAPHIIDPIIKQSAAAASKLPAMSPPPLVSVSNLKSIDIYSCFKNLIPKVWMLWEMVLLNHPIVVVSPSPPISSDSVLSLVSLISPIIYCGDYRPFFTIHDPEFHKFTAAYHANTTSTSTTTSTSSSSQSQDIIDQNNLTNNSKNNQDIHSPQVILGVTNPFFLKALGHWPTIITIGSTQRFGKELDGNGSSKSKYKTLSLLSRDAITRHVLSGSNGGENKVQSDYKPLTSPDKTILKKVTDSTDINSNNEALRRHFLTLTLSFLIPLERYFSSLLPLAKTISIFQRPPRLKNFDIEEFLNILEQDEETYVIDSKSKEIELYKKFMETKNFNHWLEEKRKEAIRHLNTIYRKEILEADIPSLLKNKNPSTALDLYKRIKDQLILEENLFQTSEDIKDKIKLHLNLIVPYLPQ